MREHTHICISVPLERNRYGANHASFRSARTKELRRGIDLSCSAQPYSRRVENPVVPSQGCFHKNPVLTRGNRLTRVVPAVPCKAERAGSWGGSRKGIDVASASLG